MHDRDVSADAARKARVVHAAIMGGVIVLYAALALLGAAAEAPEESVRHVVRIAGYLSIAAAYVGGKVLRDRIARTDHRLPAGEWWGAHLAKAVALWAVLETGGLVPIALGFVTHDRLLAGLGAAVALVLLFVTRPSVLEAPRG